MVLVFVPSAGVGYGNTAVDAAGVDIAGADTGLEELGTALPAAVGYGKTSIDDADVEIGAVGVLDFGSDVEDVG